MHYTKPSEVDRSSTRLWRVYLMRHGPFLVHWRFLVRREAATVFVGGQSIKLLSRGLQRVPKTMLLKVSMILFILKIVRLFWQFYGHSLLKTKRMKNLIKYAQNQGGGKCPISNSPSSGRRTMRSETQKCREAYPTLQSRETCFWLKPSIRPTHAVNSFSECQEEVSVIMGSFNWLWEINISSMFA